MANSSAITSGTRVTAAVLVAGFPKGVVYQGIRTTTAVTSGGTELGFLRVDDMSLFDGRVYMVIFNNVRADFSVGTDRFKFNMRYSAAGDATTSSTVIGRSEALASAADVNNMPQIIGWIMPTANSTTASVLVSLIRVSGTGTGTIQADDQGDFLTVIDMGVAVADTGVDV